MKKIIALILTLFMMTGCCIFAAAQAAVYSTAGDLFQAWAAADQYPDYIGGIWSTDGGYSNLTFGICSEEGKDEILALVENDATVSFAQQKHSKNKLLRIQEELIPYLEQNIGIQSVGVYDMENRVVLGVLLEKKDDEALNHAFSEIAQKYGDAVAIEFEAQIIAMGSMEEMKLIDVTSLTSHRFDAMVPFYLIFAAMLFTAMVWLVVRKKRTATAQAVHGGEVSGTMRCSSAEVEEMVRRSAVVVPESLEKKVFDALRKE